MEQKISAVIEQLKTVRQEKGLSYQDIVDKCAENEEYVSLSTVKRVFAAGSETASFKYDTTIQPIARVVLDLYENAEEAVPEVKTVSEVDAENTALKAVLAVKDQVIADKAKELERLISSTQAQIDTRDGNVEYLKKQVSEQRRLLFLSWGFVIVLLLFIIVALVIDKINPEIGFFWVH